MAKRRNITDEQAEELRRLRRSASKLCGASETLSQALASVCACEPHDPENCRICWLYSKITTIQERSGWFAADLDSVLERGPAPKSLRKRP